MQWTHVLSSVVHIERLVGGGTDGAPSQALTSLRMLMPSDIKTIVKSGLLGKAQFWKCPTHTLDKHLVQCVKCQATREANGPIQVRHVCADNMFIVFR